MRGLLMITSARTPYMRADLSWGERVPLPVDVRTLDGERLRELLLDQVLTIRVELEDGPLVALPQGMVDLSAEQLQLMIDGMIAELGAPEDPVEPPTPEAVIAGLRAELDAERGDHAITRDLSRKACEQRDELVDQVAQLNKHIIARSDEIAALKAAKAADDAEPAKSATLAATRKPKTASHSAAEG